MDLIGAIVFLCLSGVQTAYIKRIPAFFFASVISHESVTVPKSINIQRIAIDGLVSCRRIS